MNILTENEAVVAFNTVGSTVAEMLQNYIEGVKFFDGLDASWRSTEARRKVIKYLIDFVNNYYKGISIIASGRFGMYLHNAHYKEFQWHDGSSRLVLVSGGLRSGAPMDDLSYMSEKFRDGRAYVFIDDSYYSGKTRRAIEAEVKRHGGEIVQTIVIYDGSKTKDDKVSSMFRYYDNYAPDATKSDPNVRISGRGKP